jgi:hypothetical protein
MDVDEALPPDRAALPSLPPDLRGWRQPGQDADKMFDWGERHEASW